MPIIESYTVYRGRVLWFNEHTGYGCVVRADGQGDYLFHVQEMKSAPPFLREGEEIRFGTPVDDKEATVVNMYRVISQL